VGLGAMLVRLDEARISWQIGPGCGLPVLADDPSLDLSLPPFEPPARRAGGQGEVAKQ
jgi:hypothetical protein